MCNEKYLTICCQSPPRLLNQRLLEVQAELEDVNENQETTSTSYSTEVMAMRTKMIEATQKREEAELQVGAAVLA